MAEAYLIRWPSARWVGWVLIMLLAGCTLYYDNNYCTCPVGDEPPPIREYHPQWPGVIDHG